MFDCVIIVVFWVRSRYCFQFFIYSFIICRQREENEFYYLEFLEYFSDLGNRYVSILGQFCIIGKFYKQFLKFQFRFCLFIYYQLVIEVYLCIDYGYFDELCGFIFKKLLKYKRENFQDIRNVVGQWNVYMKIFCVLQDFLG